MFSNCALTNFNVLMSNFNVLMSNYQEDEDKFISYYLIEGQKKKKDNRWLSDKSSNFREHLLRFQSLSLLVVVLI